MSYRNGMIKAAIVLLFALPAFAEEVATVLTKSGGADSLVQKNAAASMVSPTGIVDNSATNAQSGREQKANDAKNQGNAGMAAAIATGSAMVARAIPMLASIDPVTVAAGATLMGLAGLEFAQAAASGKSAGDNGGQKDLLTSGPNGGTQTVDPTAALAAGMKADPQLNQFLQGRGVNADNFIDQFASGSLTDPQAILNATGNKTPVSGDQMAAGQQLAAGTAGALLEGEPEPRGMPDIIRVSNNDGVAKGLGNDGSKGGAAGGGFAGTESSDRKTVENSGGGAGASPLAALAGKPAKGKGVTPGAPLNAESEASMMNLFNRFGFAAATTGEARVAAGGDLQRLGILKANPKQNIFQLAHRNYRSFQKWRRAKVLAQQTD